MKTKRCLVQYYHDGEAMASVSINCTLSQAIAGITRYFNAEVMQSIYAILRDGVETTWEGTYQGMLCPIRVTITMR